MTTAFGKEVRKYRIDKDISLRAMAEKLGVSASHLSAMEIGRASINATSLSKIINFLELSPEKGLELIRMADESTAALQINSSRPMALRVIANSLSRNFRNISEEDKRTIKSILEKYDTKGSEPAVN